MSTTDVSIASRPRLLPWAALLGRLVLGGVWIAAGASKITALDESVRAVRAYRLLPEVAAQVVGAGLPAVEILLGVLLIVGAGVRTSAVVSALLMAAFVVGIASAWARGLRIDCGCFGSGGELAPGEDPTYVWELLRDGALLLLAVFLAARPPGRLAVDELLGRSTTAPDPADQDPTVPTDRAPDPTDPDPADPTGPATAIRSTARQDPAPPARPAARRETP